MRSRRDPKPTEPLDLHAAMAGNRRALEAIWTQHRAWVGAIVEAVRPRHVEFEDLLQEVALRFVRQISTLREATRIRPWLRQIARNVCMDAARRAKLRRTDEAELDTIELRPGTAGTTHALESRDELDLVRTALATLPEDMRELLGLRAIHGMSQRQLAETYAVPETTIETRLVRARRALRAALGQTNQETAPSPRRCLK